MVSVRKGGSMLNSSTRSRARIATLRRDDTAPRIRSPSMANTRASRRNSEISRETGSTQATSPGC